jgi:hypothetical protein
MFDTLFDTLLGSVIILMAIGGIIFAFAVFIATLAIRIWRKHDVTAASTVQASPAYRMRKAA